MSRALNPTKKMTPEEIKVLRDACIAARIDPTKVSAENPFARTGKTAEFIQAMVQEGDPVQAARWRKAAGKTINLETAAMLAGEAEATKETLTDLFHHDPDFAGDMLKQVGEEEATRAKRLEEAAEQMHRARVGDRQYKISQERDALIAQRKEQARLELKERSADRQFATGGWS